MSTLGLSTFAEEAVRRRLARWHRWHRWHAEERRLYPSSVPYDYVEEEDEGAVAVAKHVTDVTWGGRLDVFNLPSEAGARTNKVRAGRMLCVDWSFDQDIFTCPRDSRLQ